MKSNYTYGDIKSALIKKGIMTTERNINDLVKKSFDNPGASLDDLIDTPITRILSDCIEFDLKRDNIYSATIKVEFTIDNSKKYSKKDFEDLVFELLNNKRNGYVS